MLFQESNFEKGPEVESEIETEKEVVEEKIEEVPEDKTEKEMDFEKEEKDYWEKLLTDGLEELWSKSRWQWIIESIKTFQEQNPEKYKEVLKIIKGINGPQSAEDFVSHQCLSKKLLKNEKLLKKVYHVNLLHELSQIETYHPPEEIWKLVEKSLKRNKEIHANDFRNLLTSNPNLSKEDYKVLDRMDKVEKTPLGVFYGFIRDKTSEIYKILLNDEEFEKISNKIYQLKKILGGYIEIRLSDMPNLLKKEIDQNHLKAIKNLKEKYNATIYEYSRIEEYLEFSKEDIEKLLSEKFINRIKRFKLKLRTPSAMKKFISLCQENKIFNEKEEEIGKILSDFEFKEISLVDFQHYFSSLSGEEIDRFLKRDFDKDLMKKFSRLIKDTPFYKQISSEFIKNIKSAPRKNDYQEKPELKELLKHIATSSTFSYLALEKPNKETLEKLKEKIERSTGEKQKMYQKLYGTIKNKNFYLSEVIPGQKAIKTLDKPENINYLSLSKELDIPFDKFGVFGKDLEEVKEEVDKRGEEIIEDYSQNKERYLPYLNSLLGYGKKHKEWMNEILKADDLWEFKTSHLDNDLKSVLDKIKDLETETGKIEGKETLETPIENLEAHLKAEEFSKAKKRISLIKEENREKALELIEKSEKVINLLKQEKNPNPKDISLILANKGIFKHLELSLTWDSIRILSMKLAQGKREMEYSGSVEIFKEPEEYFGAMDKGDSCMRVEGGKAYGALTITQGPIFIIGIKDKFKKIIGRSLLIPVKDEKGKWRFELNNTYGLGEKEIEDFAKKIEGTLKKEKKDYYKGTDKIIVKEKELKLNQGELPKTKTTSFSQNPKFWRDSVWADVELKKVE